jgi:hypothetical protein
MDAQNEELKKDEAGTLISADKVQGTAVRNPAGESLGTIENIMIDKPSGKVAYAVMAFGRILGMGKDRRAMPWEVLKYDTSQGAYTIELDAQFLKDSPAFDDRDASFDGKTRVGVSRFTTTITSRRSGRSLECRRKRWRPALITGSGAFSLKHHGRVK